MAILQAQERESAERRRHEDEERAQEELTKRQDEEERIRLEQEQELRLLTEQEQARLDAARRAAAAGIAAISLTDTGHSDTDLPPPPAYDSLSNHIPQPGAVPVLPPSIPDRELKKNLVSPSAPPEELK